jgi:putative nucleotidyltransferase with HDIG domain
MPVLLIKFQEKNSRRIFLILKTNKPADGIKLLRNCGLLKEVLPEIMQSIDVVQKGHHIYDVWNHLLETVNNCESNNPITRLACLLHDIAKPVVMVGDGEKRTFHNHEVVGSRIAVKIGKRLKFSNQELDQLFRLVRWHMFTAEDTQTDKAVRRFIRNVTPEYLEEMLLFEELIELVQGLQRPVGDGNYLKNDWWKCKNSHLQ